MGPIIYLVFFVGTVFVREVRRIVRIRLLENVINDRIIDLVCWKSDKENRVWVTGVRYCMRKLVKKCYSFGDSTG